MILIFSNTHESIILKDLQKISVNSKITFITDKLPLISNLNLIENIMLPVQYHRLTYDKEQLNNDLKSYKLYDKRYYRKDSLNEIDIFFTKFLMSKYYLAQTILFINQFHHFANSKKLFFDFFSQQHNEHFVIIEKEVYRNILIENLLNFTEWDFEEWLKNNSKT